MSKIYFLRQVGFTLIELVVVLILMGIISVVVGRILFHGYQTILTSQNISESDWSGFLALDRLVDDIHNIRSAADIATASATQLIFVDVNNTTVQYQLSGTNLLRNSQTLASGIQSIVFSYLTTSGAVAATTATIRYIAVSVTTAQGNLTLAFSTTGATRGMS